MLLDAGSLPAGSELDADLVIVGSGPAGIAIASRFVAAGTSVIVLESGGRTREKRAEALNAGESTNDAVHAAPSLYRARTLGGTSSIWGGRCVPLDPIDFEARSWVPNSGWPIPFEAVDRWVPEANLLLEAGEARFDEASLARREPWIEGFTPDTIDIAVERYSPPTNLGKRYRQKLEQARTVKVVTHATCVGIATSPGGRTVQHLSCKGPGGNAFDVRGRFVVLAAGGLENARLLLVSRDRQAEGLGNKYDTVGRYYMCHIEGTLGELVLDPPDRPIRWGFEWTSDGIYARRKFQLSADIQRQQRLRNGIARLHYPHAADPSHGHAVLSLMYMVKAFLIPEFRRKITMLDRAHEASEAPTGRLLTRHIRNIVASSPDLVVFLADWINRRHLRYRRIPYVVLPSRTGRYPLDFNGEQEPNPESRVTLTNQTDVHGLPTLRIDWRMTDGDVDSIVGTYNRWSQAMETRGLGTIAYDRQTFPSAVRACVPVGGHHIGTTRMSTRPEDGVVDINCRVHGMDNLYLAGGSVFPTCGHANPTLTIVALAFRLAEHLGAEFASLRQGQA